MTDTFDKDLDDLENLISNVTDVRNYHIGESNYSTMNLQPWDIWLKCQLNPWDADIAKRLTRTKQVPGLTAKESRIQDYEKIKHICDERIQQINNGDPYYKNFKAPEWVE